MLAAMNGHTSTVKLLLDMGSDISAQVWGIGGREGNISGHVNMLSFGVDIL